ncbi:uncharacterized protein LOC121987408 [Zingiber officinale]|uniref:uncharacterized protein LOC121987408 n=1 Tax=Zingiber officinale TaxID=94328 RepID=UPI001C4CE028|nr:uncharacterized protein LOC121987408 [Zingiber officinale]
MGSAVNTNCTYTVMSSLGVSYAYLHQLRKQCMEKTERDKFEACVMAEKGINEKNCTSTASSSVVTQEGNKKENSKEVKKLHFGKKKMSKEMDAEKESNEHKRKFFKE